jgi:hypothetical protein
MLRRPFRKVRSGLQAARPLTAGTGSDAELFVTANVGLLGFRRRRSTTRA